MVDISAAVCNFWVLVKTCLRVYNYFFFLDHSSQNYTVCDWFCTLSLISCGNRLFMVVVCRLLWRFCHDICNLFQFPSYVYPSTNRGWLPSKSSPHPRSSCMFHLSAGAHTSGHGKGACKLVQRERGWETCEKVLAHLIWIRVSWTEGAIIFN